MTVENPDTIDFAAYDEDTQVALLVISDHLDWDDELAHLFVLQEKLNRYVAFVESGEINQKLPGLANRPVRIDVQFLHTPSPHACMHFLEPAERVIRNAGMEFTWNVHTAS